MLTLAPYPFGVTPVSVAGWRPQGTLRDALQTLVRTLQFLVDALIWVVVYVAPMVGLVFVLPVGVLVWVGRRDEIKTLSSSSLASGNPHIKPGPCQTRPGERK